MLAFLVSRGFTSKLSLQYLDLESDDGQLLLEDLSIGQKCLLRGLVKLCARPSPTEESKASTSSACGAVADKARAIGAKGKDTAFRVKLNKLFNFGDSTSSKKMKMEHDDSEDNDFRPSLKCFGARSKDKGKGKLSSGPRIAKGSVKRKIKQVRFRVISVPPGTSSTPVNRGDRAKEMWFRADASATTVHKQIRESFDWSENQTFQYLYVQGKCLREAKLQDIENSTSWDCESVKTLMGNGFLYVSKSEIDKPEEVCLYT